jgi:hypothetical protein
MTKIYHTLEDGEIVELRNWIMEPTALDTVIVRPLGKDDRAKLHDLVNAGLTDSQIFFRLNPHMLDLRKARRAVEVPLEVLDEKQLIWLIERDISQKLRKMSRRHLVRLFLALSK